MEIEVCDLKGGYGADLVIDGVSFRGWRICATAP